MLRTPTLSASSGSPKHQVVFGPEADRFVGKILQKSRSRVRWRVASPRWWQVSSCTCWWFVLESNIQSLWRVFISISYDPLCIRPVRFAYQPLHLLPVAELQCLLVMSLRFSYVLLASRW